MDTEIMDLLIKEAEQQNLLNEINSLFHRFCRVNGVDLNKPLTREMIEKIRAVVNTIEDERDEEDRQVRETLDDARNLGNP